MPDEIEVKLTSHFQIAVLF